VSRSISDSSLFLKKLKEKGFEIFEFVNVFIFIKTFIFSPDVSVGGGIQTNDLGMMRQGILKGEVSLYHWPPV
jgi:hypothetical protein